MKRHKIILPMLLLILYATANVAFALCLKQLIDSITNNNFELFISTVFITLAIACVEVLLSVSSQYFLQLYVMTQLTYVKNNIFSNLLNLNMKKKFNLASFSSDIDILYNNYYTSKLLLIYYIAQLTFSLISIIYLSWIISLVVVLTAFLPFIVPMFMQKHMQKTTESYSSSMKTYLNVVSDISNGIDEVQACKADNFFTTLHNKKNTITEQLRLKNQMTIYFTGTSSSFLGMLSFIATITVCGFLIFEGKASVGTMLAIIQLLNSVVSPVAQISNALGKISSSKELAKKLEKTYPESSKLTFVTEESLNKVILKDLNFNYNIDTPVLKNINIEFELGKSYAIIGKSGSGKSTLAKILAGYFKTYNGEILFKDKDDQIVDYTQQNLIQYVPQNPYVFNLSAIDNVTFGKSVDVEELNRLIKILELETLFSDTDRILTDRDKISGGQKQKLVLIRALLQKPAVMILDEPTANMDLQTTDAVLDLVFNTYPKILIVITHDIRPEVLRRFDKVITLE